MRLEGHFDCPLHNCRSCSDDPTPRCATTCSAPSPGSPISQSLPSLASISAPSPKPRKPSLLYTALSNFKTLFSWARVAAARDLVPLDVLVWSSPAMAYQGPRSAACPSSFVLVVLPPLIDAPRMLLAWCCSAHAGQCSFSWSYKAVCMFVLSQRRSSGAALVARSKITEATRWPTMALPGKNLPAPNELGYEPKVPNTRAKSSLATPGRGHQTAA